MQTVQEPVRLTRACAHCREKKVKCTGEVPCKNCHRQQRQCWYPTSRRGKRSRAESNLPDDFARNKTCQPPFVIDARPTTPAFSVHGTSYPLSPSQTSPVTSDAQSRELLGDGTFTSNSTGPVDDVAAAAAAAAGGGPDFAIAALATDLFSPVQIYQHSYRASAASEPTSQNDKNDGLGSGAVDVEEGVIPLHKVNWEHHGPWSWVSVCSQPGVKWVCERTCSNDFSDIANGLTKTWSRRLKMRRFHPLQTRMPDPDPTTAWKYVEAYFELSYDAVFGIVPRPAFECRLRAHLNNPAAALSDDPSWFALRNTVYAVGCKASLSRDPSLSFIAAGAQAEQFFHQALSVFSQIIFGHSGFTAVQALALMALYAEGLGSPALEYPLCLNAVQLAQAKGLHRASSKHWNLPTADSLNRSWLWWAIYCLEKQIAFRGGRPSIIDDDNISTPIPTAAPPGSTIDVEILRLIIRHAQISSQISRQIMSVMAFKQSPARAVATVRDIHDKLQTLLESIPTDLRFSDLRLVEYPLSPRRTQSIYLHFAIHGSLMATHIIFFYPWISRRFGNDSDSTFQSQVLNSSNTIANSARRIILTLRSLTTDVTVPAWLAFYYPMYAHINLFIFLLRFPSLSSVKGDIALLDICTGHFAHIEHVTDSEISFHFPRESAALCAKTIKANKFVQPDDNTVPPTPQPGNSDLRSPEAGNREGTVGSLIDESARCDTQELIDHDPFEVMSFDMDSWNIFSSIDITDDFSTTLGPFMESCVELTSTDPVIK